MVSSIPNVSYSKTSPSMPAIKIATPDIILENDAQIPIEVMTDLIFENIGGQEIINIARHDAINGQEIAYQAIKNLKDISSQYNSKNIIGLENTSDNYFKNFSIKLEEKVPSQGSGPESSGYPSVYLEPETGNLVIDVINMQSDEQVEIQVMVTGNLINDTIYEEGS